MFLAVVYCFLAASTVAASVLVATFHQTWTRKLADVDLKAGADVPDGGNSFFVKRGSESHDISKSIISKREALPEHLVSKPMKDFTNQDLKDAKIINLPGEPWLVLGHGCATFNALLDYLIFQIGWGAWQPHLGGLWHYEARSTLLPMFREVLQKSPNVPLTIIKGEAYIVSKTTIYYEDYGVLSIVVGHIFAKLLITLNSPAILFGSLYGQRLPATKFDFMLCCTGYPSSRDQKRTSNCHDLIREHYAHWWDKVDHIKAPGWYTGRSIAVVYAESEHFNVGWAINRLSILWPAQWAKKHDHWEGVLTSPVTIGNRDLARFPDHFCSWIGAIDEVYKGKMGTMSLDSFSMIGLPGLDISVFGLDNKPSVKLPVGHSDYPLNICDNGHGYNELTCYTCGVLPLTNNLLVKPNRFVDKYPFICHDSAIACITSLFPTMIPGLRHRLDQFRWQKWWINDPPPTGFYSPNVDTKLKLYKELSDRHLLTRRAYTVILGTSNPTFLSRWARGLPDAYEIVETLVPIKWYNLSEAGW
jgi:hypothetical protein